MMLCRKGQVDAVKLVLGHGGKATLKDVNKRGLTALGEAVLAGHTAIASDLIKANPKLCQIPCYDFFRSKSVPLKF